MKINWAKTLYVLELILICVLVGVFSKLLFGADTAIWPGCMVVLIIKIAEIKYGDSNAKTDDR